MKKTIFALALLSVTLFACTNEEASSTADVTPVTKSTSGDATIDALYASMLTTQEYIDYKTAQDAFIDKVNYNGTGDIHSSAKLLAWIDQNLSLTDFAKLSDAEAELANVKTLWDASYVKNLELFETIATKPDPGQMWADLRDTQSAYDVNSFDPCGCIGAWLVEIINNAQNCGSDFNEALGQNNTDGAFDVLNEWDASDEQAGSILTDCLKNCK